MTDELLEALREVDALTPGSDPIAPPRARKRRWYDALVALELPGEMYRLHDGQWVSREWLELNRSRLPAALRELDAVT